jgi:hypothetical protein
MSKKDTEELFAARRMHERFKEQLPHQPPAEAGKIILLCGTSTAGKTSICNAAKVQASKAGHELIIDGADVASEKAWTESCEIDGIEYLSAEKHFVNAMKAQANPSVVADAVKTFDARTLAVAVTSRRNLGNPNVQQFDLTPKEDIKAQAIEIYANLSPSNKEQYTAKSIEDLLMIIRDCREFPPYPPLQQLNELMLDRAVNRAKEGKSTILDMIGNETINDQSMIDHFQTKLRTASLPAETGTIAVAHCPVDELIDRINTRNEAAPPEDVRMSFFPFDQYGATYKKAPSHSEHAQQIAGVVKRQDIINAANIFGRGEADAQPLLDKLGFVDGEESITVVSRVKCDAILQTKSQTAEEIAITLCEQAFANEPYQNDSKMNLGY